MAHHFDILYLLILLVYYLWLCWVFSGEWGRLWLQCAGFSLQWLLSLQGVGCGRTGSSNCGACAQQLRLWGSRVLAQQLRSMLLVVPWMWDPPGQTRDQTCVPRVSGQTLQHGATRGALCLFYF